MSVSSESLLRVARRTFADGTERFAADAYRVGGKIYTQPQLFAGLVLRAFGKNEGERKGAQVFSWRGTPKYVYASPIFLSTAASACCSPTAPCSGSASKRRSLSSERV